MTHFSPAWKWQLNNCRALSDGEGPGEHTKEGEGLRHRQARRDEAAGRQANRQLDRQGVGDRRQRSGEGSEKRKRKKWDGEPEIFVRKIPS